MTRRKSTSPQPASQPKPSAKAADAAALNTHIGRELRAMFDDVVAQPVPEKFQELLEELERKQTKS